MVISPLFTLLAHSHTQKITLQLVKIKELIHKKNAAHESRVGERRNLFLKRLLITHKLPLVLSIDIFLSSMLELELGRNCKICKNWVHR